MAAAAIRRRAEPAEQQLLQPLAPDVHLMIIGQELGVCNQQRMSESGDRAQHAAKES